MKVLIPSPLRSYTGQKHEVEADGATLADVLSDLDRRYSGIRFRIITEQDTIRPHIRIFINEDQARNLTAPLRPGDQIHIICALSGG
jgi:molybdopterin synthase sulfur carrier subunit